VKWEFTRGVALETSFHIDDGSRRRNMTVFHLKPAEEARL